MIKRFIRYYKPHLSLFILDMISAVIVAVCNLFYPTIAKNIVNGFSDEGFTLNYIIMNAVLLLIVYIIKAFFQYIIGYYGHVVGVRMQKDMRRDLFEKYEKLPFSYFDSHKTGDLLSRLTSDLFDVSELAHHGPENVFLAVLMLLGSFIILSGINLTLTLIMFAVIPFIVLFTVLSRKRMRRAMKASRLKMSEINSTLENSLTGIRETKAYVAEKHEMDKFDRVNSMFAHHRSEAMFSLGFFDSIMQFLSDLLYLVVIFVGGIFLFNGKIDAGEFTAFVLYISMFLNPIHRFVALFEQLQEGMSGFSRFCDILDEPEEIDEGEIEIDDVRGEIAFDNVSFGYSGDDGDFVISALDLHIEAGKTLALVGPSGGGKTTLCNLIPRFYEVTDGKISLDGVDIRDITLASLRRNIGIVSQTVFLFDGTVRENIAYGAGDVSEEQVIAAAKRANIHDFVSTLKNGYDTEVGERGVRLSGGQRQRIAIARVFLKNPKLLILDEATSALDNATEMLIQESLTELSEGRTVIVVAHRLSTVKNADEIVVVDKSGIVERGTHDELIAKNGEYKKLYDYQFRDSDE
ncbi:MAG: ABC transporter ATP-binding protein [Ruminococcaceae bacterium]|nr:ABC transporter ATP-binding protein [Oscillospiraceae bacterium]